MGLLCWNPYLQRSQGLGAGDAVRFGRSASGAVAQATTNTSEQFALVLGERSAGAVLGQNYPNPFNPSTMTRMNCRRQLSVKPVADHSLELMDCSLKGPIRVVDENGRVVAQ